jgi:hypothetical protein
MLQHDAVTNLRKFKDVGMSSSLLLTIRAQIGNNVHLLPLPDSSFEVEIPDIQSTIHAGAISLRETDDEGRPVSTESLPLHNKAKHRNWMSLLLRETLSKVLKTYLHPCLLLLKVDLKYVTPSQIVKVNFEENTRYFSVSSVTPRNHEKARNSVDSLTDVIQNLGIDHLPRLCVVDWDTSVNVENATKEARTMIEKKVLLFTTFACLIMDKNNS